MHAPQQKRCGDQICCEDRVSYLCRLHPCVVLAASPTPFMKCQYRRRLVQQSGAQRARHWHSRSESYIIIMIGSHSAGTASHGPPRYSPTHHLAGRRHAHRPAFRLRGPTRAGAAQRAQPDDVLNIFHESLAGSHTFPCHFLTTTHTHTLSAMPEHTPSHLPPTHAQTACTHLRASHTHHAAPQRVRVLLLASECV